MHILCTHIYYIVYYTAWWYAFTRSVLIFPFHPCLNIKFNFDFILASSRSSFCTQISIDILSTFAGKETFMTMLTMEAVSYLCIFMFCNKCHANCATVVCSGICNIQIYFFKKILFLFLFYFRHLRQRLSTHWLLKHVKLNTQTHTLREREREKRNKLYEN